MANIDEFPQQEQQQILFTRSRKYKVGLIKLLVTMA